MNLSINSFQAEPVHSQSTDSCDHRGPYAPLSEEYIHVRSADLATRPMAALFILILAAIGFAFIAPTKVVAITFAMLFVVSFTIKALTVRVSGQQVSYATSLKAASVSVFLFLITGFFLGGLFLPSAKGFTFLAVGSPFSLFVPLALLIAFIFGFHICLPTSFKGSTVVAVASTAISVFAFYLLRSVFQ